MAGDRWMNCCGCWIRISFIVPFTMGASAAGIVGVGTVWCCQRSSNTRTCRNSSNKSSSEKKEQMDRLRKDIESELKEFQDKISPMAEKMKDLHERAEKVMTDFKNLEKDGSEEVADRRAC